MVADVKAQRADETKATGLVEGRASPGAKDNAGPGRGKADAKACAKGGPAFLEGRRQKNSESKYHG